MRYAMEPMVSRHKEMTAKFFAPASKAALSALRDLIKNAKESGFDHRWTAELAGQPNSNDVYLIFHAYGGDDS